MTTGLRSPRRLRSLTGRFRGWLGRPEIAVITALLIAGAILRPVVAMAPDPIAVAPQYARSAMTMYYVLEDIGYVVPVARRVSEAQISPRNAIVELLEGPRAGPDLAAPFAPGAKLSGYRDSGSQASVELAAGALDGVDPARAISALVLTLTEFTGITTVSLSVDGERMDASGSTIEDPVFLTRPAINPETPEAAQGGTELYFAYDAEDRYLVPVTRATPASGWAPEDAMDEFLRGPLPGSHLDAVLPADVGILDTRVENGMATVNFDSHLVYAYRLSRANAAFVRRAVMATLTSLPEIAAGLIEIDGSRLLLYTCVNVTQEFPQTRPWAINDEFYLTTIDAGTTA